MSAQQRIINVVFEKLRGLKGLEISFEPKNVTGIFGVNGCGKSTILYALLCFYRPKEGSNRIDFKFSQFFKHIDSVKWLGSKISVELTFREKEKKIQKEYVYRKNSDRWTPKYSRRPDRDVYFLGISRCVPDIELEKNNKIITQPTVEEIPNADNIIKDAGYILNCSYLELNNRISNKKKYLSVDNHSLKYNSLNMGAGEQRIFKILELLYQSSSYSLIIIDEIDLTIHTAALNRLIDVMVRIAEKKHIQVIFTSHREELVNRTDINIRHIVQTAERTLCLNETTSECIDQLTGKTSRDLSIFVEDDLAETIVSELLIDRGIRKRANIFPFGAVDNAFVAAIGLDITGKLTDDVLFILDGDRYRSIEEKRELLKKKYSGTEQDKEERRERVLSNIRQFLLPEKYSPEEYIHSVLVNSSADSEYIRIAKSINGVVDVHQYLNLIIDEIGESRQTCLFKIICEFKNNRDEWNNYTKEIQDWINARCEAHHYK